MKKLITLTIALLTVVTYCNGQEQTNQTIVLSGHLDTSALRKPTDTIEIHYFKDYDYQLFQRPTIYKAPLTDQRFKITINSDQTGYLMIPSIRMFSFYANLHLVKGGDSLHLEGTGKNQFQFSGNAADKLNDQLQIGRTLYLGETRHFADINDPTRIFYQKEREFRLIKKYADLIGTPGQHIPLKEARMLSTLTRYSIKGMCLFEMTVFLDSVDSQYRDLLKKEIARRLTLELSFSETEKEQKVNCFTYLFYLTDLNKAALSLASKTSGFNFQSGYEFIIRNYSGLLRDKLLMLYFGLHKTEPGMLLLLAKTITIVKDQKVKQLLSQIANARLPGSPVYPFSFQDTSGKITKLSDLKGKVVLMDSWYKGCINCAVLKKQMEAVISHFKANPNVLFLGLNVDKDKIRFTEGIKSGLYTAPETLNLYTNGLGHEHPMLSYYQYNGYPNLLLIDKQGKLISANPPRPVSPEKTKALIDLIDQHL